MRKYRWMFAWALLAVLAVSAGGRLRPDPGSGATGVASNTVRVPPQPPAESTTATGRTDADPTLPDAHQRLLEQIETARLGLLAVQAAHPLVAPAPRLPFSLEYLGISLLATLLLGAWLWSRRRRSPAVSAAPATVVPKAGWSRRVGLLRGAKAIPAVEAAPAVLALEGRLRVLEDSLLQVVRAVEASSVRDGRSEPAPGRRELPGAWTAPAEVSPGPGEAHPRPTAPAPEVEERIEPPAPSWSRTHPASADPPVAEGRGPAQDPDLSLPPPTTNDGRELPRIRRAVLRLAAEGWSESRIAQKLRLGTGDVNLILKTGDSRPKAGHAEMAGSRR